MKSISFNDASYKYRLDDRAQHGRPGGRGRREGNGGSHFDGRDIIEGMMVKKDSTTSRLCYPFCKKSSDPNEYLDYAVSLRVNILSTMWLTLSNSIMLLKYK